MWLIRCIVNLCLTVCSLPDATALFPPVHFSESAFCFCSLFITLRMTSWPRSSTFRTAYKTSFVRRYSTNLLFSKSPSTRFFQPLLVLSFVTAMATFESGLEFTTDRFTAQTFYREPVNGLLIPWMPLNPSDYHPPRPESHNVRIFTGFTRSADLVLLLQVMTHAPNVPGLVSVDPIPSIPSHAYGEFLTQPPPSTQVPSFEYHQPFTQPLAPAHGRSFPAPSVPTRTGQDARRTRRLARAHDPVRGQRTAHPPKVGRGLLLRSACSAGTHPSFQPVIAGFRK